MVKNLAAAVEMCPVPGAGDPRRKGNPPVLAWEPTEGACRVLVHGIPAEPDTTEWVIVPGSWNTFKG